MLLRSLSVLIALALVAPGCAMTHPTGSVLAVEADLASATLGDDCAAERAGLIAGDCAEADGCGFCQQTGVQIHLSAAADPVDESVPVEVMSVRLLSMEGALLAELAPRSLSVWDADAGAYVAWDGTIAAGEELEVSVDTSAPDWTAIGGGEPWSTYGMQFEVEVTLRVDGEDRELELAPAMREPEIVT